MSIFPDYAKRKGDDCDGAEPRASASPERANGQGPGAGAAASAANSAEHKEHRFDKFARKIAGPMLGAIRTALQVFSLPEKDRWDMGRLLNQLKGAEELAREMLRAIAAKITILPVKARAGAFARPTPPEPSPNRVPCFRLGVKAAKLNSPEGESELSRVSGEYKQGAGADAPSKTQSGEETASSITVKTAPSPLTPSQCLRSPPTGRGGRDTESSIANRLAALEDVLAHPGKHAARMARALYRAAHAPGGCLFVRSPDEMLLDRINAAHDAHHRGDGDEVARLHALVLEPD